MTEPTSKAERLRGRKLLHAAERKAAQRQADLAQKTARYHENLHRPDHLPETTLRRLLATDAPIVAGPWLGEVGFEILYWIPFLRWLVDQGVPAERITAISRGGP